MGTDSRNQEAAEEEAIQECGQRLLALNGGMSKPRRWKNLFEHAITPKPRKRGPKFDVLTIQAIARDISANEKLFFFTQLSKHTMGKLGKKKREIARQRSVSVRQVEIVKEGMSFIYGHSEPPAKEVLAALKNGIVEFVLNNLSAKDLKKRKKKVKKALRQARKDHVRIDDSLSIAN